MGLQHNMQVHFKHILPHSRSYTMVSSSEPLQQQKLLGTPQGTPMRRNAQRQHTQHQPHIEAHNTCKQCNVFPSVCPHSLPCSKAFVIAYNKKGATLQAPSWDSGETPQPPHGSQGGRLPCSLDKVGVRAQSRTCKPQDRTQFTSTQYSESQHHTTPWKAPTSLLPSPISCVVCLCE